MDDSITISTLVIGTILVLVSIPGFEVASSLLSTQRKGEKFPMWDRVVLLGLSNVFIVVALHRILDETLDSDAAAQISFAPAGGLVFYAAALWAIDSFKDMPRRPHRELFAKFVPMLGVVLLPLLTPLLLWVL